VCASMRDSTLFSVSDRKLSRCAGCTIHDARPGEVRQASGDRPTSRRRAGAGDAKTITGTRMKPDGSAYVGCMSPLRILRVCVGHGGGGSWHGSADEVVFEAGF